MRWILVFTFLYIIPLVILFRNNKNFKRATIYGSIYVVVSTSIVISNMYLSNVDKLKSMVSYNYYAYDEVIKRNEIKNMYKNKEEKVEVKEEKSIKDTNKIEKKEIKKDNISIDNKVEEKEKESANLVDTKIKDDLELLDDFKEDIYDIEREALVPMRECIPGAKAILKNMTNLQNMKKDVTYAKDKCSEVIKRYEEFQVPNMSKSKHKKSLITAKINVQKAYVLRQKAMEAGEKFLDTKNPKYMGQIKEYLSLSDEYIKNFIQTVDLVEESINKTSK